MAKRSKYWWSLIAPEVLEIQLQIMSPFSEQNTDKPDNKAMSCNGKSTDHGIKSPGLT